MTLTEIVAVSSAGLGIVVSGVTSWVSMRIELARLQERVKTLENSHDNISQTVKDIFSKLEEINEKLFNKQDRQ